MSAPEELLGSYEHLVAALDEVPPERRELFMAKLLLLFADLSGSARQVAELAALAREDLPGPGPDPAAGPAGGARTTTDDRSR